MTTLLMDGEPLVTFRYQKAPLVNKFVLQCRMAGEEYFAPVYQSGGLSVMAVNTEAEAKERIGELIGQSSHLEDL